MSISLKPIEEAMQKSAGARFYRCALQVNTPYFSRFKGFECSHKKGSPEYITEYARALAQKCRSATWQGRPMPIEVVGICDHNSGEYIDIVSKEVSSMGLCVFPGFEVESCEGIHLICLFEMQTNCDKLNEVLAQLGLTRDKRWVDKEGYTPCQSTGSMRHILEVVQESHKGVCIAAHMDSENGLLSEASKSTRLVNFTNCALLAGQISGSIEEQRDFVKRILKGELDHYRRDKPLALMNSMDVYNLKELDGPDASCFVKMTTPSIQGLWQAFLDPESRVRFLRDMPESPPAVLNAAAWEGGFLNGIRMHFSENLNALIGGRGTGKSTVIETLRYALDLQPRGEDSKRVHDSIVRENMETGRVWLLVRSQKQMGQEFIIRRAFGESPEIFDDEGTPSKLTVRDILPSIEVYGQNEILEVARSTTAQRTLINRFLPDESEENLKRTEFQRRLADNRTRMIEAKNNREELQSRLDQLPRLLERLAAFDKLGLKNKLAAAGQLNREQEVVKHTDELFSEFTEGLESLKKLFPWDFQYLAKENLNGLPNAEVLAGIAEPLRRLESEATSLLDSMSRAAGTAKEGLGSARKAWEAGMEKVRTALHEALATLPDMAGKSGIEIGKEYVRLTQRIEELRPLENKLRTADRQIIALEEERRSSLLEWREWQFHEFQALEAVVREVNSKLAGKVRIELKKSADRKPLKDFLLGLDGIGAKGAEWVDAVDTVSIQEIIKLSEEGKEALLARYREYGMKPLVAERLAGLTLARRMELEELYLSPSVSLLLNVGREDREEWREVENLSTGQQCTAVLHLLMLENPEPLIIDQPEENLDNAFIADRIVAELRKAKSGRQFLFATHNANIPVFSDAEWIATLQSSRDQAQLPDDSVGSIDADAVRTRVAQILEGGKHAFEMRKAKYGF